MATGLGIVIGLLLCAVIIAGLGAHAARIAADDMRLRYLPFMETAHTLEGLVYEAVFHVSIFGVSGDMASYSGARIRFSGIGTAAGHLAAQALHIPEGHILARDMEALGTLAAELDMVVEKKRTLNDELTAKQAELRKRADGISEILLDLQARQASVRTGKKDDISLDERARLLVLNGLSLAVAELTGRVLAVGKINHTKGLRMAQELFAARWAEARDACSAAAALPPPEGISAAPHRAEASYAALEQLVDEYADLLGAIRFNLEESARVTADREATTGRLTALTRNLVSEVRDSIAAAAARTDTALRGAAATLFACALLVCILAAGVAVIFARLRGR